MTNGSSPHGRRPSSSLHHSSIQAIDPKASGVGTTRKRFLVYWELSAPGFVTQRHQSAQGYKNVTFEWLDKVSVALTNCGFLGSGSTHLPELQLKKTYENSTLAYSNSFLLTSAHHKRDHTSHGRSRNGVRRDKTAQSKTGLIARSASWYK